MRYFPLLDFQYVVLFAGLGLIVLLVLYLAFGSYVDKHEGPEEEKEDYPEGIQVTNRPIPLILIFVYFGFGLWALGYLIVIGLRGGAF